MNRFSFRQLRIFTAVAERQSLAAAGRELRLSQATLSEGLRDLEGALGLKLFDRSGRRLQLTAEGRAFLKDARGLLNQGELVFRRHAGQRTLLCGASVTVGNYILPPLLIGMLREHPWLQVELIVRNTQAIADLVLSRDVEIAVVEGLVAHPQLEVTPWREDALAIIAPPGHALTAGAGAQDLAEATWILREVGSGTRESFDMASAAWPAPPKVAVSAGGNEFIKQAVAAGCGLGCLSFAAVRAEVERGELALVPIEGPQMVRTLSLVRRRGVEADPIWEPFTRALATV